MPSKKHCPFCNHLVEQDEQVCPHCGGENRTPKTIEELLAYCEKREMPLHRMRFFIGENYQKARAFGIYEDGGRYIVYKNKANGERATRYSGPDEAHAVMELFQKLLDECHKRDIYPDGKPAYETRDDSWTRHFFPPKKTIGKEGAAIIFLIVLLVGILALAAFTGRWYSSGYYKLNSSYYIHKGSSWFHAGETNWYITRGVPSANVEYLGKEYDPAWGIIEFEQSETGKDYQAGKYNSYSGSDRDSYGSSSSDYSSSDYSSWDSGDTDWDSDW